MKKDIYIYDDNIQLCAILQTPESLDKYPLMIIIHGVTGFKEEAHLEAISDMLLAIGVASIRVDMYGHGQSDGDFHDHTLLKWVSNAIAVTDYVKEMKEVTDIFLCGHSQGGLVSMLMGAIKGEDYKALIPLSPATCILDDVRRGFLLGKEFDPCNIPKVMYDFDGRTLGENYIKTARIIYIDKYIDAYDGPVLLVHADTDGSVPVKCSLDAAEKYKNAKLHIIHDDTHCYDNHLDEMVEAVKEFVIGLENYDN